MIMFQRHLKFCRSVDLISDDLIVRIYAKSGSDEAAVTRVSSHEQDICTDSGIVTISIGMSRNDIRACRI
jgi:hypothetical protein